MSKHCYVSRAQLPGATEEMLRKFIDVKGRDLDNCLFKLWNDYVEERDKEQGEEEPLAPLDEPTTALGIEVVQKQLAYSEKVEVEQPVSSEGRGSFSLEKSNEMSNTKMGSNDEQPYNKPDLFDSQLKSKMLALPNGKVGLAYCARLVRESLSLENGDELSVEGLEVVGLKYDEEEQRIVGIPTVAGDHKVVLKIKRSDWREGLPIFERQLPLIINPDPKTLWRNIPTPTTIDYYKPDCEKDYVLVGIKKELLGLRKRPRKDIVAASQRGRSHAQEGKPRDDDFSLNFLEESGWYLMAVADGAGSASASRRGAQIACQKSIEVCEREIINTLKDFEKHLKSYHSSPSDQNRKAVGDGLYHIIGKAVFESVRRIGEEAQAAQRPIKDFSTTLIVSIAKKFDFGWFVGAFWVGDGGIGIYDRDRSYLKVLGESDGGEYAGQTRFVTMPEITQPVELYRRLRFEIVDDFTALILMTDGVTDPKFETDANLLKFEKWNQLWDDLTQQVELVDDNVSSAEQLLSWLDFWSPGNHDDRTIAILY